MRTLLLAWLFLRICLTAALLWCAGCCGAPPITAGTVVGKHYHAAWSETRYHEIRAGKDVTRVPYVVQHPERWDVVIADDRGRARTLDLDREQYQRVNRGDWWTQQDGFTDPGQVEAETN